MTPREQAILEAYQRAINKIDDYLEYRVYGDEGDSSTDTVLNIKDKVMGIIDDLTTDIANIREV